MATILPDTEFLHFQDLLGSLPMLRGLIPICLCFSLNDATTTCQVEQALRSAANNLGEAFPFLTGRVVIEGIEEGHSGVPKIVRHEDQVHLIINDLTENASVASSAEMREADYPQTMLEPKLLLPSVVFDAYPVDPSLFAPIFMVQANLIRGGIVLAFVGNHQFMDATGLGYLIELYAKALRGEDFTDNDVKMANQPRRTVIPLLGEDYRPGAELDDIIPNPVAAEGKAIADTTKSDPSATNKIAWFRMLPSDLVRLKSDASKQDIAPYISTDDAVSALLWRSVSRARQSRLGQKAKTQLARPVSVRKLFGLERYGGQMVDTVYTEEEDVHELPLATVAGKIRRDLLQEEKLKYHVQALATMCSRLTDRSKLMYGANGDLNRDVLMTSWTCMSTCAYSYGDLLGIPDATRCPWKNFVVPMIILLPKDKDGAMTMVICFAEDEMQKIFQDEDLLKYGKWMSQT